MKPAEAVDPGPSPFITFEEAERERIRMQLRLTDQERIRALEDFLEFGLILLRNRVREGLPVDPRYRHLLEAEAAGRWSLPPGRRRG